MEGGSIFSSWLIYTEVMHLNKFESKNVSRPLNFRSFKLMVILLMSLGVSRLPRVDQNFLSPDNSYVCICELRGSNIWGETQKMQRPKSKHHERRTL